MTAITFPNSPSSGDTHTAGNGIVYTYDGEKWTSIGTNSAGTWTRSGTEVSLTNAGDDLNVDSGTLFVDASTDRVGVGVTSPLRSLHVAASGDVGLMLQTTSATDDKEIWEIQSAANASNNANLVFRQRTNDGTGGIEALRIDSSGRVGIGTTGPVAKLQVDGTTTITGGPGNSTANGLHLYFASNVGVISGFNDGVDYRDVILEGKNLRYQISGAERARIDSSGRLLVGTSSTSATSSVIIQNNSAASGPGILRIANSSATPANGNSLGLVTFGASNHATAASINSARDGGTWTAGSSQPSRLEFSTTADGAPSPSPRFTINSDGALYGFGRNTLSSTTPGFDGGLAIVRQGSLTGTNQPSQVKFMGGSTSTITCVSFYTSTTLVGSITRGSTSTSYNESSDYRLKENVVNITDGIARVKQLRPKRFNFIADAETTVDGFLAHEAQAVVPEAVTGTKDEVDDEGNAVMQGIDKSKLVPLLTAALQEAIAKIETLETKVAALEAG